MPAVGPGLVIGQFVAWRVEAHAVRAFIVGVAAEIQRVVGAEDVGGVRLGFRRRLPARLEAAERLESFFYVDVKPVVGEPDRFH